MRSLKIRRKQKKKYTKKHGGASNSRPNNSQVIERPSVSSLHRTLFDSIRDGIKNHAKSESENIKKNIKESMFLFSTPTKLINDLLFSIYNENLIRTSNKASKSMMMSLLELDNEPNTVYITISEEPNSDKNFYQKLAGLILMLKIILYGQIEALNKLSDLGDKIEIIDGKNYHITELKKVMTKPEFNYRTDMSKHTNIRGIFPDKERNLTDKINKIKIVCNETYIEARRAGVSFEPFYKPDKNKPQYIACNSGSICSESKIFSYLHEKKLFNKIKGAIAYWIGDSNLEGKCLNGKPTNCHIHPKYCYSNNNPEDKTVLVNMIELLKDSNCISEELQTILNNKPELQNYMFAPYALPCPGCTLNSFRYQRNIRAVWTYNICLENHPDGDDARKRRSFEQASRNATKHM